MFELTIPVDKIANFKIAPVTKKGAPAKIVGLPDWNVVSGGATLAVGPDGLTAKVIPPDALVDPAVNPDPAANDSTITATVDPGAGAAKIVGTILLHAVEALAADTGIALVDETDK